MKDIIIISGAPGSGKSTLSQKLYEKLDSVIIDFGRLREFHLDKYWKKANKKEENMAFENLAFIINNYLKHEYNNIIINDLLDEKVIKLAKTFKKNKVIIISLVLEDEELERRVKSERDSGFKNVEKAIEYNRQLKTRKPLPNELRIDNTHNDPNKTVMEILKLVEK